MYRSCIEGTRSSAKVPGKGGHDTTERLGPYSCVPTVPTGTWWPDRLM